MREKGIPLDAPLFEVDPERGIEYWNCEILEAWFTSNASVASLLPDGLSPATDPPTVAILVADYGRSTIGPYREATWVMQVTSEDDEIGLYVPYLYVTSDVALAGGREGMGYPKKLAEIEIRRWADIAQGIVERPAGNRLLTLTMQPNDRLDPSLAMMFGRTTSTVFTQRHVPGLDGRGGLTQLVKSQLDVYPHVDARGKEIVFSGRTSVVYDSPTAIDPVHRLEVVEMVVGVYIEFDAVLKPLGVVQERFVPALATTAAG